MLLTLYDDFLLTLNFSHNQKYNKHKYLWELKMHSYDLQKSHMKLTRVSFIAVERRLMTVIVGGDQKQSSEWHRASTNLQPL